jgi:CHAT domain-containing protein
MKNLPDGQIQTGDLAILGRWLLPDSVLAALSPEKILFIAPHRELHFLPWSALIAGGRPLVTQAIPAVIPSLHSLAALGQRMKPGRPSLENGLLLAAADFQDRHSPLPQTILEVEALKEIFPGSRLLCNEEMTWSSLGQLATEGGLSDYSYLHIATHAFSDTISGRLSGLAFYDRDVWLDELWDYAPLPGLVALSACSGSKGRLYEGDEQVGLATTCLAAGAQHVVASLWQILDQYAADFMLAFYQNLAAGQGVAEALAVVQRQAWESGETIGQWGSFRCTGMP